MRHRPLRPWITCLAAIALVLLVASRDESSRARSDEYYYGRNPLESLLLLLLQPREPQRKPEKALRQKREPSSVGEYRP